MRIYLLLIMLLLSSPSFGETWFTSPAPSWPVQWVRAVKWGSKPGVIDSALLHRPSRIAIHHAGVAWKPGTDPVRKVRALQSWGRRAKGWPDLPYHFLISPDGMVFEGRATRFQPESNTSYNLDGVINIQLFGDFEQQLVTEAQKESLVETTTYVCRKFGIPTERIYTHRQLAPEQTTCPGKALVTYIDGEFFEQVSEALR